MTKLALGVVMALTVPTGQAPADFMDGNQLYADCTGNTDSFQRGVCLGYIEATADYMAWVRSDGNKPQCMPASVVLKQVEDVVIDYLRDHPVVRSNAASALVATAISQAWSCK
jgi:hypothetical protein